MNNLKSKTIVVNLIGEPGCGKSFFSFWLTQELKAAGIVAELVPEIVKYECYHEEGKRRVRSGRYDFRYLRLQSSLIYSLLNHVQVIVNDGALESFWLYALSRIPEQSKTAYEQEVSKRIQHIKDNSLSVHYVMPKRLQDQYETIGRNETEEESALLRTQIVNFIQGQHEPILFLDSYQDRQTLVETLVKEVRSLG